MREFTVNVFDETIGGTTTTWYTSSAHNDLLGSADQLLLQWVTTGVSGTIPILTIAMQHSCNGLDWLPIGSAIYPPNTPEVNQTFVNETTGFVDRVLFVPPMLTYVRFQISLGNVALACRLKIWVTGRTSGAA